jgi:uncharacterized membrane protein
MLWGLSLVDWGALAIFVIAWQGFAPYLRWQGRRAQVVATAMIDHRRAWMEALLKRDIRIADTAIVGHIMSTAAFFASTTVMVNMARGEPAGTTWLAIPVPTPLEMKVVLVIAVAVYAFQSFTWAIRQANFAAVMMGAAPPAATIQPEQLKPLSASMGNIITGVAESYDNGMRSYYFAFAAVTWVVSPVLLILATVGVVALLLRRQTKSRTAVALKELAVVRGGELQAN